MHCINILIVDKENLIIIQDKLENIKSVKLTDNNSKEFFGIPIEEFYNDDIQDTFDDDNLQPVFEGLEVEYVIVKTEYFGGCGEQSAIYVKNEHVIKFDRINEALKNIGVIRNIDNDEFDAINLGKYRSNINFYPPKTKEIIQASEDNITFTRQELRDLIFNTILKKDLGDKVNTFLSIN